MLRPRNVIVAVFAIAAISILWAVFKLAQPPDSDGYGGDTYGTRYYGYRGLYELLGELGVGVDRALSPPINHLNTDSTLVFLDPDAELVQIEPAHLKEVASWVQSGGHAIVATGEYFDDASAQEWMETAEEVTILEALGLNEVRVLSYHEEELNRKRRAEAQSGKAGDEKTAESPKQRPSATQVAVQAPVTVSTGSDKVLVETSGDWNELNPIIEWMQVPHDNLQVIAETEDPGIRFADAELFILGANNQKYTIAAKYAKGKGTITVISDARVLRNYQFYQQDNAIIAAHLFAGSGKPLLFDEFYHGLTVRGNPAWLLTQHPYGLLAVLGLVACGVWIARSSNRLGPSLPIKVTSRRAIGEYIDAVAGMFDRGKCQDFVLRELKYGVIWSIAKELRLGPRNRDAETVVRVLERRDAKRAELLQRALLEVDVVLRHDLKLGRRARRQAIVQTARKLTECL